MIHGHLASQALNCVWFLFSSLFLNTIMQSLSVSTLTLPSNLHLLLFYLSYYLSVNYCSLIGPTKNLKAHKGSSLVLSCTYLNVKRACAVSSLATECPISAAHLHLLSPQEYPEPALSCSL